MSPDSCFAGANLLQVRTSIVAVVSATNASQTSGETKYTSNSDFSLIVQIATVGSAEASLSGTNTVGFTSGGTVRPGFLSLTENCSLTGLSVGATHTLDVGTYSQSCTESTFTFPFVSSTGTFSGTQTVLVPLTLGQAFTFVQTITSSASVSAGNLPHYASGLASVQIALFEGDPGNLRPVPMLLAEAPEPGSFALQCAGIVALVFALKGTRNSAQWRN